MTVQRSGYKFWKLFKKEWGVFCLYITPCILCTKDNTFEKDRWQIKFAWLFWNLDIYFG